MNDLNSYASRLLLTLFGALWLAAGPTAAHLQAQAAPWHWPGTRGKSGVNGDPFHTLENVQTFCAWRGRPCQVAHAYTDRRSWEKMLRDSAWVLDNYARFAGQLVISQGLIPEEGDAGEQLAACAAGQHDGDFKAFGELLVQRGRADSIVRLGWEFNGDFMRWAARDTQQWIDCYRHAAIALRQGDPGVVLDWTINSHSTPSNICRGSSIECYPGDDVVDIIGIDNYDFAPSATSREHFARIADAPDGLNWLAAFARRHNKPVSVGEWSITPGASINTTGQNPEFIRWMNEWFTAHADQLAYETYFHDCSAGLVESNLMRPVTESCPRVNSAAAAVYASLWSAADNRGSGPAVSMPAASSLLVDAGSSTSYLGADGRTWLADAGRFSGGGGSANRGAIAIVGTSDAQLFQTERWCMDSFHVELANGVYSVRLYFAETFDAVTAPGQRVFDVDVMSWKLSDLDVFAEAGGRNVALAKTFETVWVTSGRLDIAFTRKVECPMINAIEIVERVRTVAAPSTSAASLP